jgi:hypothetical protein
MKKILMQPHNPRKGFKLRRLVVRGKLFEAGKTYKVDPGTAEYLLGVRSEARNDATPLAFMDVTDRPKALKKQKRATLPKSIEVSEDRAVGTLTTADLPENQPSSGAWDDDDEEEEEDDESDELFSDDSD